MNKTDFSAKRDMVGITQRQIADELEYSLDAVKKWEKESTTYPPEKAENFIKERLREQQDFVAKTKEDIQKETDSESKFYIVRFAYFRSQEQFDSAGKKGDYGVYNANVRAAALELLSEGYFVEFRAPTEMFGDIQVYKYKNSEKGIVEMKTAEAISVILERAKKSMRKVSLEMGQNPNYISTIVCNDKNVWCATAARIGEKCSFSLCFVPKEEVDEDMVVIDADND